MLSPVQALPRVSVSLEQQDAGTLKNSIFRPKTVTRIAAESEEPGFQLPSSVCNCSCMLQMKELQVAVKSDIATM